MEEFRPEEVEKARSALRQKWRENTVGGPADAIYPEKIPGGLGWLWRKNVLGDCHSVYYALATSYFELDSEGPDPDKGWQRWAEVKASLRKYYVEALNDDEHERHRLYMNIEIQSRWSLPNGLSGSLLKSLHTNDKSLESWTPFGVFQVMADYYDVEVIVYHTSLWTSKVKDINGKLQILKRLRRADKEVIHAQEGIDLENRDDPGDAPLRPPLAYGHQGRRQLFLWSTTGRLGGTINIGTPNWPIDCGHTRYNNDRVRQYQELVDERKICEDELWNRWRLVPYRDPATHPTEQEIAQVVCGQNVDYEDLTDEEIKAFQALPLEDDDE